MASVPVDESIFLVSDWRDYISKVEHKIEPDLYESSSNYSSLRYLDTEAKLDAQKLNSKYRNLNLKFKPPMGGAPFGYYNTRGTISTTVDVLSKIMLTPFNIESCPKWNELELCTVCTRTYSMNEIAAPASASQYFNYYRRLKNYYFIRKPHDLHRAIISPHVRNFYGDYRLKFDGPDKEFSCKVFSYSADIPGVTSDGDVDSLGSLKAADLAYCDVYETGQYPKDVVEYNPVWWSKAALTNAKHLYIGSYNEDGFQSINKFPMEKFSNTASYENIWAPSAAWNFLKMFFRFVTVEINIQNLLGVKRWRFENCYDGTKNIRCLHYKN